jgi:hypothetical protein
MTNNILRLTLKKKWFDMIASGEKKEEYRENKEYWQNRLQRVNGMKLPDNQCKHFEFVHFTNGYAKNAPTMLVECKGISIGKAKPEWSDNWQGDVFIISLGAIA